MRYSDIQIGLRPGEEERTLKKPKEEDPFLGEAWAELVKLIGQGSDFTSDDLWDRILHLLDPNDPITRSRKLAANKLFARARDDGLVVDTGISVKSKQVTRHSGKVTVWRPVRRRRLVRIGGRDGQTRPRST